MNDSEILLGLTKVKENYGLSHAKRLEQLFRNETAHFKSGNFLITYSPGMEATKKTIPYGWTSLKEFWTIHPEYAPIGLHEQKENTSALAKARGIRTFIKFPNVTASMMSVGHLIKLRGGDFGSWFANDPIKQKAYNAELDKIKVRLIK